MKAITTFATIANVHAEDQDGNKVRIRRVENDVPGCTLSHRAAAAALCRKMEWPGNLTGGFISNARMVWVFTGERRKEYHLTVRSKFVCPRCGVHKVHHHHARCDKGGRT